MIIFESIGIASALLLSGWTLVSVIQIRRSLNRIPKAAPRLRIYPSLSVIRPIKGLDFGIRENLRSAFEHGYPGWLENIFVFDDDDEPALPILKEEIRQARSRCSILNARILFSGNPPPGYTGKVNAMMRGLAEARGELVAFADSDIRPSDGALRLLVQTLMSDKKVGSVFAPVRVTNALKTASDAGYALMLNGLYTPVLKMVASRLGFNLPFIMGQLMVFRRETLESIGGLEMTRGQLVDDMYIGKCLNRIGLENRMVHEWVPVMMEGMSFTEFRKIYRKWITFSRSGLPGSTFKFYAWMEGVVFWAGLILAALSALLGLWTVALSNLLAPLMISAAVGRLHRLVGGVPLGLKHFWTPFALFLSAPLVYLSIYLKRRVEWRGRSYELSTDSKLAVGSPEPAPGMEPTTGQSYLKTGPEKEPPQKEIN